MIEMKRVYEDLSHVELFIDGVSKGVFATPKKAQIFIDENIKKDIVIPVASDSIVIETNPSGVSQKNDEHIVKRRGRPKKADINDRR